MAEPKSVTLRGKRWKIKHKVQKGYTGSADHPKTQGKCICLDPKQSEQDYLETVIHECLHCCVWDLDEESVTETAEGIARLLWKMGYRKN